MTLLTPASDLNQVFNNEFKPILPNVRRYARWLASDQDKAEDLYQEACVRIYQKLDQYEPGTSALAWARTVTHSVFVSMTRRKHLKAETLTDEVPDKVGYVPPRLEDVELSPAMRQAFNGLTPDHRDVLILTEVQGHTNAEAAVVLDVEVGTVFSRRNRARDALRRGLAAAQACVSDENDDTERGRPCLI